MASGKCTRRIPVLFAVFFFIHFLHRIMFFFLKSFIHIPHGQSVRIQLVPHSAGPAVYWSLCNIVLCFAGNMRNSCFRPCSTLCSYCKKKIKNWNVLFVPGLKNKHNTCTRRTFRAWPGWRGHNNFLHRAVDGRCHYRVYVAHLTLRTIHCNTVYVVRVARQDTFDKPIGRAQRTKKRSPGRGLNVQRVFCS